LLGRREAPPWLSAIVTKVATAPQDVFGAATLRGRLCTEIKSEHETD